ncbi:flavohemoglobin expression-modulating QEGLA motif protein [Flagellimonas sp. HMM57]|uniref:flavohemoglobin expression-modulating QEGLA motif protein n=1 Tax=unclassified Flagellimonas TaxID=2644544 RepID=UPI0013D6DD1D|nr:MULTISPECIES: flavohemoglobin expression-modulating QEGLA motif protein [unclassified Flagellimonas]UII75757.1 flavohemoglobin expression-modulating QEGLA motif protein [Flagellimonas sp. HMM57]
MIREHEVGNLEKEYDHLFEIDANLDRLVRRIELLNYINPLNIEKEKQRFFASKFTSEPNFKYPKLKFNPYKLHRLFFSQRLERIADDRLRQLYQDVIYHYANMIQCIETIGKGKNFYYNSLRVYGTPRERDVQNARFILHFADEPVSSDMEKVFSPEEAKSYFLNFSKQYDFPLQVRFSTHIAADAMVSNSSQTLVIKKNAKFSKNQLLTLANHEIGVHLVTTYNGLLQPLKIFSNGLAKNVETQEGLAVFSEYMGGALTLKRLKELAYRVLAADSLIKGYSFADTFDLIHGQYKLNRHEAFAITLRAHRGGGFTKDRLYLSGLSKIYRKYQKEESLDVLFTGKVALENEDVIRYLKNLGLAQPITYKSHSFAQKLNTNTTLDFILNNLK